MSKPWRPPTQEASTTSPERLATGHQVCIMVVEGGPVESAPAKKDQIIMGVPEWCDRRPAENL